MTTPHRQIRARFDAPRANTIWCTCGTCPSCAWLAMPGGELALAQQGYDPVAMDAELVNDMTGGEPQPGTVEHFPWAAIGRYDWSRAVVEQVAVGEDGSQTVTFAAEVCMAAGDLANGTRPNVYTVVARVAVVDGAWKISAASMSQRKVIR